jgi:DNA polymerase-3 subunit alpha
MIDLRLPDCPPWSRLDQLRYEKEITGFYMSGHPLDDFKLEIEQFCNVTSEQLKSDLSSFKGKEVCFAGTVVSATHKTGKTGKPFGSFTIEDYVDFISVSLFSEDYLRFKHFMDEGQHVFIKVKIEPRYDNPDQLTLKVLHVSLLAEVIEKNAKLLTLTFPIDELNDEAVDKIHQLVTNNKGKCRLRIRVIDQEKAFNIELQSKKFRVNAKEVIKAVRDFPGISFHLSE